MIELLLRELQVNFQPIHRSFTASFTGTKEQLFAAHDFISLSEYVDYLSFTPVPDGSTRNNNVVNSLLKIPSKDDIINSLIEMGLSQSKILMRVSFLGVLLTPLPNGAPIVEPIGYNEICADLFHKNSEWNVTFDAESSLTVASHVHDDRSMVFESGRSIVRQIRFAMMRHHLAGVIVYLINSDDSLGKCDIESDTFSDFIGFLLEIPEKKVEFQLLRVINESIFLAMEENIAMTQPGWKSTSKTQDDTVTIVFGAILIIFAYKLIMNFVKQ